MFRIAHILVTIAALLACPFNCMGQLTGREQAGQVQGCGCCRRQCPPAADSEATTDSDPSERSPAAPGDDGCECGNCLCRGALLTDDDLPRDLASCAFFPAPSVAWLSFAPAAGGFTGDLLLPHASLSGRLLRLALESLQI